MSSVAITNNFPLVAESTAEVPFTLAKKPTTADSRDEEFEGSSFSGWTQGGTPVATAIDPYANFATVNEWRHSWNSLRASFLMLQASTGGAINGLIHKAVTVNVNDFVYARVAWPRRSYANAGSAANDGKLLLMLSATSAGAPSSNDNAFIGFTSGAGTGSFLQFRTTSGGVSNNTDLTVQADLVQTHTRVAYIGMHKVAGNIHFWLAGEDGAWIPLGTKAYTGAALDRVSLQVGNATGASPGCAIVGLDFIRFKNTASALP